MRWFIWPVCAALLISSGCLEPPRDNPFDPNNPDKGSLAGTAYDYEWDVLEGAQVKLQFGGNVIYTTQTDAEGWYEFPEVAAGVYTLVADAEHYNTLYYEDVEIKSYYNIDSFDLHFRELYLHFDNEVLGTEEPFGFRKLLGVWQVQEDAGQPEQHSTPNVYNATHPGISAPFAVSVFTDTLEDFWIGISVKVLSISSGWHAGLVLRYQDESNYYLVAFTPDALSLVKIQNGNPTQLAVADTYTFTEDTWYYVSAYVHEDFLKVYLDGDELFEVEDTSSPIYSGTAGLWVYTSEPTGVAAANFDDVYIWP
jgi:hypothetical protein